ncbi:MAG: aminotransferase [Bacteroidetes bacterium]|nr:aminotransferase [Bacteroidota bacterium]
MIQAAIRTQDLGEYYFSKKLAEIDRLNEDGADIINLGIGNPDLLPPPNAVQQLMYSAAQPGNNGYQSYRGIPELRSAFAAWYDQFYGISLKPEDEILPLMGSKEGIMHISLAFLNPGDEVLIPDPAYPTYQSVSKLVGADIKTYSLSENNDWYPDFDELEAMDLSKVKIMWVNYPNMPTGKKASRDLFQRLVDFGIRHEILICNDNPYSFILNDDPISIFEIPEAKEVALELNSLSKSHNMAGFRVGMVAGKSEYIHSILKIKSNMDSGMYKPVQLAAVKALENNTDWYESINNEYKRRREVVFEIFDELNAHFDKDQGGLFIWAKIPNTFKNAFECSDKFLSDARIFITPGGIFGKGGDAYLRISLCNPVEVLNESLQRVKKLKEKEQWV